MEGSVLALHGVQAKLHVNYTRDQSYPRMVHRLICTFRKYRLEGSVLALHCVQAELHIPEVPHEGIVFF